MANRSPSQTLLEVPLETYLPLWIQRNLWKSDLRVLLKTIPQVIPPASQPEYQRYLVPSRYVHMKKSYHTLQKEICKKGFNKLNLVPRSVRTFKCVKTK